MIKCLKCGKFINTKAGEKCPHCGATERFIDETVTETLGLTGTVNNFFTRLSIKKLLINLLLSLFVTSLGLFFAGVQGVVIGFLVSVIIFLKVPPFKEIHFG